MAVPMLWAVAVLGAVLNIRTLIANVKPWGVDWRAPGGTLLDFRDLVVVPGRYLWQGGNPYDPVPYLAAHPWAQEFDPYSPAWLLISAAIGWLPLKTAALIYLTAMTVVSFTFARLLARWALPRWASLLAPIIAIWFQIWFPARGLGSSFLVIFGIGLTLACLRREGEPGWLAAVGLALAVLKPQFGLPFAITLLSLGHLRTVGRGALLAALSALPPLVACIVAAGGPSGFAGSIMRVVRHASSPEAPTGLMATDSYRVDLPGLAVRLLGDHPGNAPLLLAAVVFLVVLLILWQLRPETSVAALIAAPAIYLLPVHLSYDIAIMAVSAAAAADLSRRTRHPLSYAILAVALLPVVHLHRISTLIGLSPLAGDVLDAAATMATLTLGCIMAVRYRHLWGRPTQTLAGGAPVTAGLPGCAAAAWSDRPAPRRPASGQPDD